MVPGRGRPTLEKKIWYVCLYVGISLSACMCTHATSCWHVYYVHFQRCRHVQVCACVCVCVCVDIIVYLCWYSLFDICFCESVTCVFRGTQAYTHVGVCVCVCVCASSCLLDGFWLECVCSHNVSSNRAWTDRTGGTVPFFIQSTWDCKLPCRNTW